MQELRADVADTVAELTARLDRPVRAGRAAVTGTRRVVLGAAAVTLVLVLVRRLRARRSGT